MSFSRLVSACAFGLTGVAFVALATPGFAAGATAAQSTTKACSQQYQAAKKANSLNGETWPQFLSKCSASMHNTTTPAPLPPAKSNKSTNYMAPANTNTNTKTTKSAAAVSGTTAGHKTTQQICSSQYQAAKSAGTLGNQKWPEFLSSCSASIKNDKSDAAMIPPDPTTTSSTSTAAKSQMAPTSATGKPLTPGEVAFRQRIHECSTEWQSEKANNTLPAGAKWPQFWSQCNTRLKNQG